MRREKHITNNHRKPFKLYNITKAILASTNTSDQPKDMTSTAATATTRINEKGRKCVLQLHRTDRTRLFCLFIQ